MKLALGLLLLCAAGAVANLAQPQTSFAELVDKYMNAEWRDEYLVLLQEDPAAGADGAAAAPQPSQPAQPSPGSSSGSSAGAGLGSGTESAMVGACEVCVYVIENKEQHQPYLCRGLKDPNYQKGCVEVMESLMWWLTNEVYWLNYGCQRTQNGAVEWVRPCPAHAVCSWIEHLYTRTPFCPLDPYYKKPQ
jgi:hypothetical protein